MTLRIKMGYQIAEERRKAAMAAPGAQQCQRQHHAGR